MACAAALAAAAVLGLILMRHGPAGHPLRLADNSRAALLLPPGVKPVPLPMLGPGSKTGPHPLSPSPNTGGGGTKVLPGSGSPHPDTGGPETEAGPRMSPPSPEVEGGGQGVGAGRGAVPDDACRWIV